MRFLLVAVGSLKRSPLRPAQDDYLKRISRYFPCEEVELKDGREGQVSERIQRAIPPRARVVALEVEGKPVNSQGMADLIARAQQDAVGCLVFLVGGAYGLPQAVSRSADLRLSMSAMTFPHRLVRVMLAEQVYRGLTILNNEPYSH